MFVPDTFSDNVLSLKSYVVTRFKDDWLNSVEIIYVFNTLVDLVKNIVSSNDPVYAIHCLDSCIL